MSAAYLAHRAAIRAIMDAHYGKKLPGQPFLPSSVRVGPFTDPGEVRVPPNVSAPYAGIVGGVSDNDAVPSNSEWHSHSGEQWT
jgi:hypothetical protein